MIYDDEDDLALKLMFSTPFFLRQFIIFLFLTLSISHLATLAVLICKPSPYIENQMYTIFVLLEANRPHKYSYSVQIEFVGEIKSF